jgi:murein DD-endopeptidase MepM/ murein hydrolase activator NlpD
MFIPHSNKKCFSFKLPSVGIMILIISALIFTAYNISLGLKSKHYLSRYLEVTKEYIEIKDKLDFYSGQFAELRMTINTLKKAESQFKRLFSLDDKKEILETLDTSDYGSLDMVSLRGQIEKTMDTVGEIRDYLRQQRDIYFATPMDSPVEEGYISSSFGWRKHPKTGKRDFHPGVDIAAWPGTPVRAPSDGIVSFSGWSGGSGKLVVIEHGFGFTTAYAHNKKITVKVAQKVSRGDIIAYVGSTGNTTGPHVHYEVWLDKKPVNPIKYIRSKKNAE